MQKFVSKLIHVLNPSHFQLNIIYLQFLVPGGMFVAIVIAVFEFTWKQRKLAVDENVSNNSIKLSCTVHTVYGEEPLLKLSHHDIMICCKNKFHVCCIYSICLVLLFLSSIISFNLFLFYGLNFFIFVSSSTLHFFSYNFLILFCPSPSNIYTHLHTFTFLPIPIYLM